MSPFLQQALMSYPPNLLLSLSLSPSVQQARSSFKLPCVYLHYCSYEDSQNAQFVCPFLPLQCEHLKWLCAIQLTSPHPKHRLVGSRHSNVASINKVCILVLPTLAVSLLQKWEMC